MKVYAVIRSRRLPLSLFLRRRAVLAVGLLSALALAVAVVSAGLGSLHIAPLDVIRAVMGQGSERTHWWCGRFACPASPSPFSPAVPWPWPAPSGVLQGIIRNPLAAPGYHRHHRGRWGGGGR